MIVLNLTNSTRLICLRNVDIQVKAKSLSKEFVCSDKMFRALVTGTRDYQNVFRFILDGSERSLLDVVPVLPQVLISMDQAKEIMEKLKSGGSIPKMDIHGNSIESEATTASFQAEDKPAEEVNGEEDKKPETGAKDETDKSESKGKDADPEVKNEESDKVKLIKEESKSEKIEETIDASEIGDAAEVLGITGTAQGMGEKPEGADPKVQLQKEDKPAEEKKPEPKKEEHKSSSSSKDKDKKKK